MEYAPAFIADESKIRHKYFDNVVGALHEVLDQEHANVEPQVLEVQRQTAALLAPAEVRHGVLSLGARDRNQGKIPLAFLNEADASGFYWNPRMAISRHPIQQHIVKSEKGNGWEVKAFTAAKIAYMTAGQLLVERVDPDHTLTESRFFCDKIADAAWAEAGTIYGFSLFHKTGKYYLLVNYWPQIVMRQKPTRTTLDAALTLVHEQQHVIQTLFERRHFTAYGQLDRPACNGFMNEIEAFSVANDIAAGHAQNLSTPERRRHIVDGFDYKLLGKRSHTDSSLVHSASTEQLAALFKAAKWYKDHYRIDNPDAEPLKTLLLAARHNVFRQKPIPSGRPLKFTKFCGQALFKA